MGTQDGIRKFVVVNNGIAEGVCPHGCGYYEISTRAYPTLYCTNKVCMELSQDKRKPLIWADACTGKPLKTVMVDDDWEVVDHE